MPAPRAHKPIKYSRLPPPAFTSSQHSWIHTHTAAPLPSSPASASSTRSWLWSPAAPLNWCLSGRTVSGRLSAYIASRCWVTSWWPTLPWGRNYSTGDSSTWSDPSWSASPRSWWSSNCWSLKTRSTKNEMNSSHPWTPAVQLCSSSSVPYWWKSVWRVKWGHWWAACWT